MVLILFYLFSFMLLPKCDSYFCDGLIYLPPPHFFQLYRCHYFIKFSDFHEDFFKILTSFMAMGLHLFFFVICFCYLFIKACCFNPMIVPLKKIMIDLWMREALLSSSLNYRMVLLLYQPVSTMIIYNDSHLFSGRKSCC